MLLQVLRDLWDWVLEKYSQDRPSFKVQKQINYLKEKEKKNLLVITSTKPKIDIAIHQMS